MNKFVAAALAGAAMVSMAGTAQAAVTFTASSVSLAYSSVPTADLHKTSSPTTTVNDVKVGPQIMRGTFSDNPGVAVDLFGYCVDIFETAGAGTFNVVSLSDYLGNATKASQIAALINLQGDTKNKLHDAAVQLAIWEIINETRGSYDIDKMSGSSGQFWIDDFKNDPSGAIKSTAESYIAAAVAAAGNPTPGLNLYVAQSLDGRYTEGKQDILYWTRTAVPEPATWAMMLIGLGAIGHSMRSRRTRTAVAFS